MKAYFLTEEQIQRLIVSGTNAALAYLDGTSKRKDIKEITNEQLRENNIVPNEVSPGNCTLDVPCRFVPIVEILGFAQREGVLKGVFIK